jgi:hypothetical protein
MDSISNGLWKQGLCWFKNFPYFYSPIFIFGSLTETHPQKEPLAQNPVAFLFPDSLYI